MSRHSYEFGECTECMLPYRFNSRTLGVSKWHIKPTSCFKSHTVAVLCSVRPAPTAEARGDCSTWPHPKGILLSSTWWEGQNTGNQIYCTSVEDRTGAVYMHSNTGWPENNIVLYTPSPVHHAKIFSYSHSFSSHWLMLFSNIKVLF